MLIDFDKILTNIDGAAIKDALQKDITLRSIGANALLVAYPDERLSGDEQVKRFKLAIKISVNGEVDVTPEEIVLIKQVISKGYAPLVVGRCYEILG